MRRFCAFLAAVLLLAQPVKTADAQSTLRSTGSDDTTYLVDGKGTTLYRNGVPLCHVNCAPGTALAFPRAPLADAPLRLPTATDRAVSADRYPLRPEELDRRAGARPSSTGTAPAYPAAYHAAAPQQYPIRPYTPPQARALPATPVQQTQKSVNLKLAQKPAPSQEEPVPLKSSGGLTKEQKALILNIGGAAAITAYGVGFWDYFQTSPKADGEDWFGRTTKHGGADKLGHFWATYSMSHLFSYVYRWWDYDREQANTLGALSGLGLQTLMEVGDAFSADFGFSYEDALMNFAGAGTAYLLGKYPELANKIDFRLEYKPTSFKDLSGDLLTDYERQRYLIALKLDGFEMFHNSYLSYLELQAGYYTRGYDGYTPGAVDNRRRNVFMGVGFNVSKLVQNFVDIGFFDYIQVPYTSASIKKGID